MKTVYIPTKVEEIKNEQYSTIHIVLIGERIPMMAQWRSCEGSVAGNGIGKWFSMGMSEAKEIPKGVTHYLKPVEVDESDWMSPDEIEDFLLEKSGIIKDTIGFERVQNKIIELQLVLASQKAEIERLLTIDGVNMAQFEIVKSERDYFKNDYEIIVPSLKADIARLESKNMFEVDALSKEVEQLRKIALELYNLVHESDLIENKIRANDLYQFFAKD